MKRKGKLEDLLAVQAMQVERLRQAVTESQGTDLKLEEALSRAVGRLEDMLMRAGKAGADAAPALTIVYDYGEGDRPQGAV